MLKRRGGDFSTGAHRMSLRRVVRKRFLVLIAAAAIGTVAASFMPSKPQASATVFIDMGTKLMVDDDGPHVVHGHGTGVSIGDGFVLTAAHVADDPDARDSLTITDSLGKDHAVEVLWANHNYDVAASHERSG
jgi:hypothetical protein